MITVFLSSIITGFTCRIALFVSLFFITRKIRLGIREYLIDRRARAVNARLAPRVDSALPFGLFFVWRRLLMYSTGVPGDAVANFRNFPEGTQVIRTREIGFDVIHTLSHLDAKHVLTTGFEKWGKAPPFVEAFKPLLGEGVFLSDQRGLWEWHRALTRPHFLRERGVANVKVIEEHMERVLVWLEKKAEAQEVVDIQEIFGSFTLTVATQHYFGHCVDTLNHKFFDRPMNSGSIDAARFVQDFTDAQFQCMKYMALPSMVRHLLQRFQIGNKAIRGVSRVVDDIIADAEKKFRQQSLVTEEQEIPQNLFDHLYQSECSAELLRHQLINILLAAYDTSTCLLTTCIYELAGRNELWNKLRDEVATLPDNPVSLLEQVRKLKLLNAVINETLRLHPPVWYNGRYSFEEDVLPSGIYVPAGARCQFYVRQFQRDPLIWGKNAEDFVPERWLDGKQNVHSKDPFVYQPFGAGPRLCLGQQAAYTMASVVLARLLQSFSKVELAEPLSSRTNFKEWPSLTLKVRGGLWVRFQK
ncbi:hypothetical protein CROQUDRAFT_45993 [Cronartium quercuum f. sp. fusiforme G11]|uniref:Cytochrome P450 n=1 Tax=Cronartium quercuum f. sp. fusiforme G11 TaxID=708437 RepID=A0A9P6NG23_9BASI|nr:hypothetical protein CROQUDRAFT_45993 [Cronartium quercuum f. sp. fusiforme G11]